MTRGVGSASKKLMVDVLTHIDQARDISDEWDALAVDCEAQPFGLPALALPWWEHLGKGELRVVTARHGDGSLAGVAPLFERRLARMRTVRFLGHGLGAIGGLISRPSKANVDAALWEALRDEGVPTLTLSDYRSGAGGFETLRRADDWEFHAELSDECPVVDLKQFPGTQALLAAPAKSGVRKKLAKAWRTTDDVDVSLTVTRVAGDVFAELDRLEPLYSRAEELHPRLHLDRPPHRSFFRSALTALADRGQLAILTLNIDGEPAAFDVYVLVGSVAYAILGRYDPRSAAYSPGLLLMDRGVQWAAEEGIHCIDWQLGADPYKLRWSTDTYDTFNVVAGAPGRVAAVRPVLSAVDVAHHAKERVLSWRT